MGYNSPMKNLSYLLYIVVSTIATYYGRYKVPPSYEGITTISSGAVAPVSLPLPAPYQDTLTEQDYREGRIPGPRADRGVPVYWRMQTYDSLTRLAASCQKKETLYIEHHLNAGLNGREEAYTLTIATKKALDIAQDIACWWANKRGLKAQTWNSCKFTVIRECERRGISFIILEPAFVDALNKDAPAEVIHLWDEYTSFISSCAKLHGYKNVALLIGHEDRDGGASLTLGHKRYCETTFYQRIRANSRIPQYEKDADVPEEAKGPVIYRDPDNKPIKPPIPNDEEIQKVYDNYKQKDRPLDAAGTLRPTKASPN